jgi:hypothetical protein
MSKVAKKNRPRESSRGSGYLFMVPDLRLPPEIGLPTLS